MSDFDSTLCDHFGDMTYHHMAAGELADDWTAGRAERSEVTAELYALARSAFAAAKALREADDTVTAEGDLFSELAFEQAFGGWVQNKFAADAREISALPTTEEGDR